MKTENLLKFALYGICAAICAGALWILVRYALPVLLPFALAYAISCAVCPAADWLYRKTKTIRSFWAVMLIVLTAALITTLLWFGASVLIQEASDAVNALSKILEAEENPISRLTDRIAEFGGRFNIGRGANLSGTLPELLSSTLSQISAWVTGWAGGILSVLPSFIFSLVVGILSLFYFCLDGDGLRRTAAAFLPERIREHVGRTVSAIMRGLGRFIKAYFTIMLITFLELLCGFLVMGVEYAYLWALLIAIVDILPVLGVGTVLVPWSILSFLAGNSSRGVSLLVLLGVMYVVRQALEPRIIGKTAGVHPVIALIFVYGGFRLAGVGGMIIAPILLNAGAVLWEERPERQTEKE